MPIIRKSEVQPSENPYARLRLRNNPFLQDPIIRPRARDPRASGQIFADGCRREVITRFEKLLIRTLTIAPASRSSGPMATKNPVVERARLPFCGTSSTASIRTGAKRSLAASTLRSSILRSLIRSIGSTRSSLHGRRSSMLTSRG